MSLARLLMPMVSRRLLSADRLARRRAAFERARARRAEPHRVRVFLQVDDPYSALLAAVLPTLAQRYPVRWEPQVVGPPTRSAAPEPDKLVAWSRRDAAQLAARAGLVFTDPGEPPAADAVAAAEARLVAAADRDTFPATAAQVLAALWRPGADAASVAASVPAAPTADVAAVQAHRARANALRERLGHYLGATLHYGDEWYWGLDRLHHLERRLRELGVASLDGTPLLFDPPADPAAPLVATRPRPIEFFLSLRSPYTAIAAPRVFALARAASVQVHLRFLLPMAMRGLPVPRGKRTYIAFDAAREARRCGVPFGTICDPIGVPAERGLAVLAHAIDAGRGPEFLLSFLHGAWAEGLDAGRDRGLRAMAERAGLDWAACSNALADASWRAVAEENRRELFACGLWGVPTFRVGDEVVWGQDRLWAVADALGIAPAPAPATAGAVA